MNSISITQSDHNRIRNLLAEWHCTTAEAKARKCALARELDRASIVASGDIDPDVITLQSRAQIVDLDSGDLLEFTLVLPDEADIAKGRISILAPLGTAMLGFRQGDYFEWEMPGGQMRLRVESVCQSGVKAAEPAALP